MIDIEMFLGNATATPREGGAPLEVQFAPGNPYDVIIEKTNGTEYMIVEKSDSDYIIVEGR
ncbi:MAG: hypothetical protein GY853_13845 [PVC group bacterium]|nr:hypothetical protein [PVC group bacterium]